MGKPITDDTRKANAKRLAEQMTPEERRERARKGGRARGTKGLPRASHCGDLVIGDITISCAVVDGRRLITQTGMQKAFGKSRPFGRGRKPAPVAELESRVEHLPVFLASSSLVPFITDELLEATTLTKFVHPISNGVAYGYDASILPRVCKLYLQAHRLTEKGLPHNQKEMVKQAQIMLEGLAEVGITALVDECTGYQDTRARDELAKILEAYIEAELRPWTKKFPPSFFIELYRLYGWKWDSSHKHPACVGKFINKWIYERMPAGVVEMLRKMNPTDEHGRRRHCHHQYLTEDVGQPDLQRRLIQVITMMKAARNMGDYKNLMERLDTDVLTLF